jgi:hypothetical protein
MKRHRVLVTVMLAAMVLVAGCTSSDDADDETTTAAPATTVAPPETATTATTATTEATTTTAVTSSSTPEPDAAVGQAFLEALSEGRWAEAESLSSGRANRYVHYLNVANRVAPERFSGHVSDTEVTTGQVVFHYDDGTSIVYNEVETFFGLVVNFKRNGHSVGSGNKPGSPGEASDVTVTVTGAFTRPIRFDKTADLHPIYGEHTETAATDVAVVNFLTIEVHNATTREVDGWSAVLVTPDGRSAEVTDALSGSYPANAITDDVLIFTRLALLEGAELRIRIDDDSEVVAEVWTEE